MATDKLNLRKPEGMHWHPHHEAHASLEAARKQS
jgi:hypothetical protein